MTEQHDALDALWENVLQHWDDPKAHHAFLQVALQQEALDRAAQRYRSRRGEMPDDAIAQEKLQAIALLAVQAMESHKTKASTKTPRWLLWLAGALCAGAFAVLAYALSS